MHLCRILGDLITTTSAVSLLDDLTSGGTL